MTATLTLGQPPTGWADYQARGNAEMHEALLQAAKDAHRSGQSREVEKRLYGCRIVLVPEGRE